MKRRDIGFLVFMLVVGFSAVSAVLVTSGVFNVASNTGDFDVYFSKVVESGIEKNNYIKSAREIEFSTELSLLNEEYILEYEVTNGSKNYDAEIKINCIGGGEYLSVDNRISTMAPLKAREVRKGKLVLSLVKVATEDKDIQITCEIMGSAVERTTLGNDEIDDEDYLAYGDDNLLKSYIGEQFYNDIYGSYDVYNEQYNESCSDSISESCQSFMADEERRYSNWKQNNGYGVVWKKSTNDDLVGLDREKVETITFKNVNEVPDNVISSWDVSFKQNGSIMLYTLDEDGNNLLEVYIGQDGGVVANPDSNSLFSNFSNLKGLEGLEYFETVGVINMSGMFSGCRSLTSLDLSDFDTRSVIETKYMFNGLSSLKKLNLSSFDTKNIINMESMFGDCCSLTSLDLSNFDTRNVTNMMVMFYSCSSLISLDLKSFDTHNVINMEGMFSGCSSLIALDLKSFGTHNVINMAGMFAACYDLTNLNLGSFDTRNVTNMEGMFSGCSSLMVLDLKNFDTRNVANMMAMFNGCSSLITLDLNSFDTHNVTTMYVMFAECSNLTTLNLSNFDTRNVTNVAYMFTNCASLTTLDLSSFDTQNVTNMECMFINCNALTQLNLTNFDIQSVTNVAYMFSGCFNVVTSINIIKTINNLAFNSMFGDAAINEGAKITVNYSSETSDIVDLMIDTKSANSNVVKGVQI